MYEWSSVLAVDSTIKKAVDSVICSICYIHPEDFSLLLEWMGIAVNLELTGAITDDHKEEQLEEPLTDDTKADNEARSRQGDTVRAADPSTLQAFLLQDLNHMMVDEAHLMTLAMACQSPDSLRRLLDSGFVAVLCQGLFEFCTREILMFSDTLTHPDAYTDASKSGSASASPRSPMSPRRAENRSRNCSESSHTGKRFMSKKLSMSFPYLPSFLYIQLELCN